MGLFDFITEINDAFGLIMLGFKIVILIFIVGWVRGHLGGGLVATVAILIIGWFVFFEYFAIFGPMAIVYLILIIGGSGVIMDLAFGRGMYLEEPFMGKDAMEGHRPPPH